jgi:putative oxidoreductase
MLQKMLSTQLSDRKINICLLVLRSGVALLMMPHGYQKLVHYAEKKNEFMQFMGMSPALSLALVIFAELFCAGFLAIGFLSRFALIPLVITMGVAVFEAHSFDIFGEGQLAFVYLISYFILLYAGPGKISVDQLLFNKK